MLRDHGLGRGVGLQHGHVGEHVGQQDGGGAVTVAVDVPDVPAKAGAKLHLLVPYALEEQVAQDIESLLDALMTAPTMAPFVSQQLIQHLVTSTPSPAYVARVSAVIRTLVAATAATIARTANAFLICILLH